MPPLALRPRIWSQRAPEQVLYPTWTNNTKASLRTFVTRKNLHGSLSLYLVFPVSNIVLLVWDDTAKIKIRVLEKLQWKPGPVLQLLSRKCNAHNRANRVDSLTKCSTATDYNQITIFLHWFCILFDLQKYTTPKGASKYYISRFPRLWTPAL